MVCIIDTGSSVRHLQVKQTYKRESGDTAPARSSRSIHLRPIRAKAAVGHRKLLPSDRHRAAAILFGPAITAVLGTIVLLYQSLFLAHGGLTTLGANVFSMGIVGPVVAYTIYKVGMKLNLNFYFVVFLAATLGDWATYVVTSVELALAFPADPGGVMGSFKAFATIFALTQVPLAIIEGAITALIFKYIIQVRSDMLARLNVLSDAAISKIKGVIS